MINNVRLSNAAIQIKEIRFDYLTLIKKNLRKLRGLPEVLLHFCLLLYDCHIAAK